jgi:membrane-associated phospholipid phosphatase
MLDKARHVPLLYTAMRTRLLLVLRVLGAAAVLPAAAPPVCAQTEYTDPYRFWKWPVEDARALVGGLATDEALYAAGAGGVLYLLARHDLEFTEEFRGLKPPGAELAIRVVDEVGNIRAVRPLAILVFVGALMTDDRRFQDAAFTSLEAVVVSNLITNGLKTGFGRARPWQEEGPMAFHPFSGNTSFPSGHATTAFALVTPWLLYYPNAITPGLLILSTGTAFSRVVTEYHWMTDVLAGGAIGFATAYWLTRRHQAQGARLQVTPVVGPEVGVQLRLRLDP